MLLKNRMVTAVGDGYGAMYFVSPELDQNYEEFLRIWDRMGSK